MKKVLSRHRFQSNRFLTRGVARHDAHIARCTAKVPTHDRQDRTVRPPFDGWGANGYAQARSPGVESNNALTRSLGLDFDVNQRGAVKGGTHAHPKVHVGLP